MLSKMFKGQNPFEDQDAAVRHSALKQLDVRDPEAVAVIVRLLESDPDVNIRRTAAKLCPDFSFLANLLMDAEFESLVADRILNEVTDVVDLAITHPRIEVRKCLARLIQSDEQLSQLEKRSRDHDKALNRYARDTLHQRAESQSKITLAQCQGEELIERLENQLRQEPSTTWNAKIQLLTRQWQKLLPEISNPEALLSRYQVIVQKVSEINMPSAFLALVEQANEIEKNWKSQWPVLEERFESWQKQWLVNTKTHDTTGSEAELFVQLTEKYEKIKDLIGITARIDAWLAEETNSPQQTPQQTPQAAPQTPGDYHKLWRRKQKLITNRKEIKRLIAKAQWPVWLAANPSVGSAERLAIQIDDAIASISTAQDSLKSTFADTERQLEETLADGQSELVMPLLSKCRELLKQLPDNIADKARDQIDALGARFDELRDWKTYATEPKREAHCVEMELLITSNTPIPERAEAIKDLRNRWNQLGQVRGQSEYKFQKRFNEAANKAFEACKEHFDLLAEKRTENLQNRQAMLAQLGEYLTTTDWASTDIKAAETIMRSVRKEWSQYHPVPRGKVKKLEKKLDELMDQLHGNIKHIWNDNIEKKQAIVASAQELLTNAVSVSSTEEKINTLKTFQKKWQSVGATPRGPDQKLWKAFRATCDEVFGLRDKERDDQNKAYDELRNQAMLIIKDLHAAAEADSDHLSRAQLREFQSKFKELEAPKNLVTKFSSAESVYHKKLQDIAQQKTQQQTLDLKHQDELLHQWECDTSQPMPENLADCFSKRLAGTVIETSVETLHKLAINAELLAGLDSPEEDASLRMAVQVEHLQSGLGQRKQIHQKPAQLALQWCESAHSIANVSKLRDRFFIAIEQMLAR